MNISQDFKKRVSDEFIDAAQRMKEEQSALKKLYWFSASFNMAQRVMNLQYDDELLFLFTVCQQAHRQIVDRIATLRAEPELGTGLADDLFAKLEDVTRRIGEAISKDEDITPLLRQVAVLGYSVTGNGYYLWKKNELKLE